MNVYINGINGRMGQTLVKLIKNQERDILIVDQVEDCNVIIDFSTDIGLSQIVSQCVLYEKPLVTGTTNLSKHTEKELAIASKKIPIVRRSNFSPLIEALYSYHFFSRIPYPLKITITEIHHKNKKDTPSGTSLALAEFLQKNYKVKPKIVSKRLTSVVGTHEITLHYPHETLTIIHKAFSRKAFAQNAIQHARELTYNAHVRNYTYEQSTSY